MHAFYSGLGAHIKIVFAILQLLIIYHFYVFYILKPTREKLVFWQVVVCLTLTGGGYSYLRGKCQGIGQNQFHFLKYEAFQASTSRPHGVFSVLSVFLSDNSYSKISSL